MLALGSCPIVKIRRIGHGETFEKIIAVERQRLVQGNRVGWRASELLLKIENIDLRICQREQIAINDQRFTEMLTQIMQHRPQNLLCRRTFVIRPEQIEQTITGLRIAMCC